MESDPEVNFRNKGSGSSPEVYSAQKLKKMKVGGHMGNEEMRMNRALMKEIAEKKKILVQKRLIEEMTRKRDSSEVL